MSEGGVEDVEGTDAEVGEVGCRDLAGLLPEVLEGEETTTGRCGMRANARRGGPVAGVGPAPKGAADSRQM